MGRRALLFGLGAVAAACIACTAILGDFQPTADTRTDGGDGGGSDAPADSSDAGPLSGFLATSVSAGAHHTCGVRDGRVYCWGRDLSGQLGQSPSSYPNGADHPVKISALGQAGGNKAIIAVAAGYNHTCALDGEGSVFCWGLNDRGQLGDPLVTVDTLPHPQPTQVVQVGSKDGFLHNVTTIAAGEGHTCATSSSTVYCWGDNTYAQSGGDPALAGLYSAAHDIGGNFAGAVLAVTAGPKHTCASTGTTSTCWGTQMLGELGLNADGGPPRVTVGGATTPTNPTGGADVGAIGAGEQHTCAQTTSGTIFGAACWGDNTFGQVGASNAAGSFYTPTAVADLSGVDSVVTGASYSCARLKDKTVACWGTNILGQLGQGTTLPGMRVNPAPKPVASLVGVTALAAGFDHACAIVSSKAAGGGGAGQVFCWGAGANNQLGIGPNLENQSTPKLVNSD